jgi:hypothetical protein
LDEFLVFGKSSGRFSGSSINIGICLPVRHSGVKDPTPLLQRRSRVGFSPNFPIIPHAKKRAPVDSIIVDASLSPSPWFVKQ